MNKFIPLLAPKPLEEWTPEEYRTYVESMLNRPVKKEKKIKLKKHFVWSFTKTGKLSIKINREPKHLLQKEIERIAEESKLEYASVLAYVIKRKFEVRPA